MHETSSCHRIRSAINSSSGVTLYVQNVSTRDGREIMILNYLLTLKPSASRSDRDLTSLCGAAGLMLDFDLWHRLPYRPLNKKMITSSQNRSGQLLYTLLTPNLILIVLSAQSRQNQSFAICEFVQLWESKCTELRKCLIKIETKLKLSSSNLNSIL